MIMNMGPQECDSFDQDDIEDLQAQLARIEGPSLADYEIIQPQPIVSFASRDILRSILDLQGRDIKLIGHDIYSHYNAFFYILLLLGVEEHKNYPHLNTLIRQQFYKPNIFEDSDEEKAELARVGDMLKKSLKYFEDVSEGVKLEDYIIREPIFEEAGRIMLKNSVEAADNQLQIYEQLASKFNIDMRVLRMEDNMECYQFGANKRYHLIKEHNYYFVTTTHLKEENGLSRCDLESVRSGESGLQFLIEASEQSTPKFKNSQIKFHKKSHKNSFGGQLQNFQYRELVQKHAQKEKNNVKVFSEYIKDQHRENQIQSCAENMLDVQPQQNNFDLQNQERNETIIKTEMKGSTTIDPSHHFLGEKRKDRKISASEIIEPREFTQTRFTRHDSVPQVYEQDKEQESNKGSSYPSLVGSNAFENGGRLKKSSYLQGQRLERIEQMQSSQKESTHPDQQSQKSSQRSQDHIQMLPTEIQVKLKDRKYSYFTQQMASSKSKKLKQIQNSNYVFKLPKPHHKNSQVIVSDSLNSQYIKRRFEDNALRFSQMRSPSQDSVNQNVTTNTHRHRTVNLQRSSSVYSLAIASRPDNWLRKEIIYYLPNNQKEVHSYDRTSQTILNDTIQSNHYCYSYPVSEHSGYRTSLGSSNSLLSKQQVQSASTRPTPQQQQEFNPYKINQNAFLKNRSLAYFEKCDKSEDSIICPSFQSLQDLRVNEEKHQQPAIKSMAKIKFNYMPSTPTGPERAISSQPLINSQSMKHISSPQIINQPRTPTHTSTSPLNSRYTPTTQYRPQSHPGRLNQQYTFENRFFRSPNQ